MTILITAPGSFLADSTEPLVGRRYILEDPATGTNAQNRAFHALVSEYFTSGLHSYSATNLKDFRNQIKLRLGMGYEAFVYALLENGKPIIKDAKTYHEIPEEIRTDPDLLKLIRGRLKSWADYTKKERRETLDRLISEMIQAGVNTPKFEEILEGLRAA